MKTLFPLLFAMMLAAGVNRVALAGSVDPFGEPAAGTALPEARGVAPEGSLNFVFLVVDDMGYGDCGFTGHPFNRTPNIDALAASGAVCEHFYSPHPICSPSRAAMLTGRQPYRIGLYSFIHTGAAQHLPDGETTIPQLMRRAGYQTALSGKWHLNNLSAAPEQIRSMPSMAEYGWDWYLSSDDNAHILNKPGWHRNGERIGRIDGFAADASADGAIHWLTEERDADLPFCLFVTFYEPHWRVAAPEALLPYYAEHFPEDEAGRAHYGGCIENTDAQIGRILETLDELSLADRTVVVFTSDHGPNSYAPNARNQDRNAGTSAPYRGLKYALWDGSVHVPGIIRWPGRTQPGQRITEPMGAIDFLPTLCAEAGLALPADRAVDGADLRAAFAGQAIDRETPLQWHHYNADVKDPESPCAMLRSGRWLVCGFPAESAGINTARYYPDHTPTLRAQELVRFELYDLHADPGQRNDLAQVHPDVAGQLAQQLHASNTQLRAAAPGWGFERRPPEYAAWARAVQLHADAARGDDPDGDGLSNLWEFVADTDPLDADDRPEIQIGERRFEFEDGAVATLPTLSVVVREIEGLMLEVDHGVLANRRLLADGRYRVMIRARSAQTPAPSEVTPVLPE